MLHKRQWDIADELCDMRDQDCVDNKYRYDVLQIKVMIFDTYYNIVLDTAAELKIISLNVLEKIRIKHGEQLILPTGKIITETLVGKKKMKINKQILLNVFISDKRY